MVWERVRGDGDAKNRFKSYVKPTSMNPLALIVQVTGFTFAVHLMGWGR